MDSGTDSPPEHGVIWNRFSQALGLIVGLLVGYAVGGDTNDVSGFVTLMLLGVPVAVVVSISLDWLRKSAAR